MPTKQKNFPEISIQCQNNKSGTRGTAFDHSPLRIISNITKRKKNEQIKTKTKSKTKEKQNKTRQNTTKRKETKQKEIKRSKTQTRS